MIEHLAARCLESMVRTEPAYYGFLSALAAGARNVVELGTGSGLSGAHMMLGLPPDGRLTTINWPSPPSGDDVGRHLAAWKSDHRLTQILGDTRDEAVAKQVAGPIDLLFIDSGTEHTYDLIAAEWDLWESALADCAVVCMDDLDFPGGGIRRFWDALPYDKIELAISPFGFGVFQYERARP